MRLRLGSGACLVSLFAVTVAVACGSSPDKKAPIKYMSGGEGGDAGSADNGGRAGSTPMAGDAGSAPIGGAAGGEGGSGPGPLEGGAGAGGDGNVKPFHGVYVGTTGNDMADGTQGTPFKTLAHAASVAVSGDTIVFLDGTFNEGGVAVPIPDGVDLMAQNSGAATLKGTSNTLLSLQGNTRIEGLKFQTYGTVVTFAADTTATGKATIVDSTFTQCQTACLSLSGSASADISGAPDFVIGNGGPNFALLAKDSSITLKDGVLENYTGGNVINLNDNAKASLDGTKVTDGTAMVMLLDKQATASLTNVTIATLGQGLITQRGESVVTIDGSDLSMKPAAMPFFCMRLEMNGLGGLTIKNSKLHDCNGGFSGTIPASLILETVEVYNMAFGGMDLGSGAVGVGGSVHITGSNFHDVTDLAVRLGNDTNLNDFRFRSSKFSAGGAGWDTIYLQGSAASTFDLGTLADPGGNTFLNTNANQTALWIGSPGVYAYAVGNTWTPKLEGADPQGHYNAPAGAGKKLEASSISSGQNYQVPYNAATILLAQNP